MPSRLGRDAQHDLGHAGDPGRHRGHQHGATGSGAGRRARSSRPGRPGRWSSRTTMPSARRCSASAWSWARWKAAMPAGGRLERGAQPRGRWRRGRPPARLGGTRSVVERDAVEALGELADGVVAPGLRRRPGSPGPRRWAARRGLRAGEGGRAGRSRPRGDRVVAARPGRIYPRRVLRRLDLRGTGTDVRGRLPRPTGAGGAAHRRGPGAAGGRARPGATSPSASSPQRFDGAEIDELRVPPAELAAALDAIPAELRERPRGGRRQHHRLPRAPAPHRHRAPQRRHHGPRAPAARRPGGLLRARRTWRRSCPRS